MGWHCVNVADYDANAIITQIYNTNFFVLKKKVA